MRAIEVEEFGGPEVLTVVEVAEPAAGAGQVGIRVRVCDTLWLETMVRSGGGGDAFPVTPPYFPGVGVAGVLETGEHVIARLGATGGGYAEFAVAPAEALIEVPDGVDDRTAAALLHDGTTAVTVADLVGIEAGERVLVTAAAGGLGALLVQLAVRAGATVVAAARGHEKLGRLRELGAETVDYSTPGWAEGLDEVDVVLDGAGGDYGRAATTRLAPGGRLSAHGMPGGGFAVPDEALVRDRKLTVTGIADLQLDQAAFNAAATRALELAAERTISPLIGQTFPLEQAAAAHRAIEERTAIGKTLLLT